MQMTSATYQTRAGEGGRGRLQYNLSQFTGWLTFWFAEPGPRLYIFQYLSKSGSLYSNSKVAIDSCLASPGSVEPRLKPWNPFL